MKIGEATLQTSPVLGYGNDVLKLPEGHLVCQKCGGFRFECWQYGDNRRIEMGCMKCDASYRLQLPQDVKVGKQYGRKTDSIGEGRFTCKKHPKNAMILIHNVDVLSVGCEKCVTELNICLRKSKGILLATE